MKECIKIGGAAVLVALLAANLGTLAVYMLGETNRSVSPRPVGAQEERNPESQRAKADQNQAEAGDKQQPSEQAPVVFEASHTQPTQQKAAAPTDNGKKTASDESIFNPWQPSFNFLLVIFTGVQAFVGSLTYFVYKKQAATMHRQAEGLEAANKVAGASAEAAKLAAEAALEANRLSEKAHLNERRPWVSVFAIEPGPIIWDVNGCNIYLTFHVENHGSTPALDVEVHLTAYAPLGGFNPHRDQAEKADWLRGVNPSNFAVNLFPGQKQRFDIGKIINRDQINSWKADWEERGFPERDYILPYVFGCVQYRETASDAVRQTGFIISITREGPVGISPSGGDIRPEDLRLWVQAGRID